MLFLRALKLATLVTVVLAYGGPPDRNAQCSSIRSDISRCHAESQATSYCSSFLSIGTKTVTAQTTRTRASTTQAPTTVHSTTTPKTTITSVVTSTSAPQVVLTSTTLTSLSTVTFSSTSTLTSSSLISRTVTSTALSSSTTTSSETSVTTSISISTTTKSVLDTNFQCFTSPPPAKRDASNAAQTGLPQEWWRRPCDDGHRQQVSSACSCLSLSSKTTTVAGTSTGVAAAPGPGRTVTSLTTASPSTLVVTSTVFTTLPVMTSTLTSIEKQTTSTTTTILVSTSEISTTTFTSVVTSSATVTSTIEVPSTSTSLSTTTVTHSVGSDLTFQVTTPNNGNQLFAAAAVSSPPYNFFYFRTQGSGATTYRLDANCQLLETFAGVYAQQKPSDPNPGIVFSGSGVPVTCRLNLATNGLDCANPGGGDQTFLCDTSFGANTYPLWWLGNNNSPGSRCRTADTFAKFTL